MKKHLILIAFLLILVNLNTVESYKSSSSKPVHQHITKEAVEVWDFTPIELKNHTQNPLDTNVNDPGYDSKLNDDMIDASGEEDYPPLWLRHFWEPDNPENGNYDDGLNFPFDYGSSYKTAQGYWTERVIPLYQKGKLNEAYYWLGRVAHLLEDSTVPAHMHLDIHVKDTSYGDDSLEEYTGENYSAWEGSSYNDQQYDFEDLPNWIVLIGVR